MLYNPQVIVQCLSTQANYISYSYGQMFYYTDTAQLWVDVQNNNRVKVTNIDILYYERQRNNYIPTVNTTLTLEYKYVYVVETNCLYTYTFKSQTWSTIYGRYGQTLVAQTYYPNGTVTTISADDVTTNGILNDGSVVIRDNNKMICGLVRSDGYVLNALSLIGGQYNIEPSGTENGKGCLKLNSEEPTLLNNDLIVFGDIEQVDSTEWNKQYKVLTQNTNISSNSILKAGSTILPGSIIVGTTVVEGDTVLAQDVILDSGYLVTGCKLCIGTIINGAEINPPFVFDITTHNVTEYAYYSNKSIEMKQFVGINVEGTDTLTIGSDCPFRFLGDTLYLNTGYITPALKKIKFNDKTLDIDYIDSNGIGKHQRVVYYGSSVKILP